MKNSIFSCHLLPLCFPFSASIKSQGQFLNRGYQEKIIQNKPKRKENELNEECETSRRMIHRELINICYNNFIIIVFYHQNLN